MEPDPNYPAMKLSADQIAAFDRDGYLFFPSLFSPAEIQVLLDAVPADASAILLRLASPVH